jgi:A/G-specific adenine glycosylase
LRRSRPRAQPPGESLDWFRTRVLDWFSSNRRPFSWRETEDEYPTLIAEALLQRTTARVVDAHLPRFLERFPTWETINRADVEELEHELRPLGLWRRRAAVLKRLAAVMSSEVALPPHNEALRALPGVGQYIANAVSLVVHGERRPLLDSSMARVLERFFGPRDLSDIRYDPYLQLLARRVVDTRDAKALNWAILDLAARVCRPKPECELCPLASRCPSAGLRAMRRSDVASASSGQGARLPI